MINELRWSCVQLVSMVINANHTGVGVGGAQGAQAPHFSPKYVWGPSHIKKWAPLHHPKVDNTPCHMSERKLLNRSSKVLYPLGA